MKSTAIPMDTEENVINCLRSGTLILETADKLYTKQKALMAQGLADVTSEVSFIVPMVNVSDTPVILGAW